MRDLSDSMVCSTKHSNAILTSLILACSLMKQTTSLMTGDASKVSMQTLTLRAPSFLIRENSRRLFTLHRMNLTPLRMASIFYDARRSVRCLYKVLQRKSMVFSGFIISCEMHALACVRLLL